MPKRLNKMMLISLMLCMIAAYKPAPAQHGHASCFVYHRVGDARYPSTNISEDTFREQLDFLKENNYQVMSLGEVVQLIRDNKTIPGQTVVLTFDDAYLSFYENGIPLLEKYGYRATLFVNPSTLGGHDYMDWDQLIDAGARGIEIGNHSYDHQHFLDIRDEEERKEAFAADIEQANALFGARLDHVPKLYSYPYGEYGPDMIGVLEDDGYLAAAAQYSGVLHHGAKIYAIPRFPMGGPFATMDGFTSKLSMLPLEYIEKEPHDVRMSVNPPRLHLKIRTAGIDPGSLQCFVDGERNCDLEISHEGEYIKLSVISRQPLKGRRSLYTITARSAKENSWCWFSHLWVNVNIEE